MILRPPRFRHDLGIAEIPLTKGKVAIIDICDAERVLQRNWYASLGGGIWYARTKQRKDDGTQAVIYLHRFLLEFPSHLEVDHRNGDSLDNRRCNLRLANDSDTARNSKRHSDNVSGFKGVCWDKEKRKWCAQIGVDSRVKNLGRFHIKEEAAYVYDQAAIKFHGEFARINGAQPDLPLGFQEVST